MDLNYRKYGEGEPVVVLHGLFGMLDNWQSVAKKLASQYEMTLVDLPNHGRSPHTAEFSYPSMADAVHSFLKVEGIHRPHIIGHSMGGKVAMQMAVQYPDSAKSLIIVDIGTRTYTPHHRTILDALRELDIESISARSQADEALGQSIPEPGVRLFLMKNLTRQKEGGYTWKMNLPLILDQYDNILQGIEAEQLIVPPSLFIRGGKSRYILDEDWPTISEKFKQVRLETIVNAGHWVHAEQPALLIDHVTAWLKDFGESQE